MSKESVTLYFREGSSDKVYQVAIDEKGGGFVVNFAYGRRGATLQTGIKTAKPVPFEQAKKIYDKLVAEKMSKGYTPGEDGTPYVGTDKEVRATGIFCQLLNSIDPAHVGRCIADERFLMQEKFDGKHILLGKQNGKVTAINRKGLECGISQVLYLCAASIPDADFLVDGEAIGDKLMTFDILMFNGKDLRPLPYKERLQRLSEHFGKNPFISMIPSALTHEHKGDMFDRLLAANAEGVVFKDKTAPYSAGRPASGGPALKFKFVTTGSFFVDGINDNKRSVVLGVLKTDGEARLVGSCTIPPNKKIPLVGDVVEVRYLYAFSEGSLFQPVFLGVRDDLEVADCPESQLKYKRGEVEEEG